MACAAIGMMAPASSAAPCRTGRHRAAAMTTAASATMSATSPAMTTPGFEKALPAVRDCVCPAAERKVKLSQAGANATAAPSPARISSTAGPNAGPRGRLRVIQRPRVAAGWSRRASTDPAAQASQPSSPSTRPAPPAVPAITVPASAKNKPNVTTLIPVASSAPIRNRVPPSRISTALAVQPAR